MKRKLLDEKMTESMPISNFRLIMSASLAGPETSALSVFDDTGVFGMRFGSRFHGSVVALEGSWH